jgi:hypothetical protein
MLPPPIRFLAAAMRQSLATLLLLLLPPLAQAEGNVYRVVIDGRIQAIATLRSSEGQEHGQIHYDSSGADGLELSGAAGPKDRFEWNESLWTREASDSKPTGLFSGKLSGDGKSGQGIWKSADGKKNLPLTLTRLATLETLDSKEAEAWADYPRFDDPRYAQLNSLLSAEAQKTVAEQLQAVKEMREEMKDAGAEALDRLSSTTRCDVEIAASTVVSLLCTAHGYSGGAHGNTALDGRNYALAADGAARPLGLWDVLKKSPAAITKLSSLIVADLKRQKASTVVDGGIKDFVKELEQDQLAFTVVPTGLAFHFSPYAVASYAEGHFRAVIPSRAIAALYRRDGPLAARAQP